jgi:RimJ/RimL family protein N-acetyltransferase
LGRFGEAALTTRRLLLTPLRPQDAGPMAAVLADERLHEFIGGRPASPAALRERYRALAAGSGDPDQVWLNWIVRLRDGGEPAGTVQATVTRRADETWTAAVAWIIGVRWQGRGYASEAAVALVTWLGRQGAEVITASIHPGHHASAAVARHAGLAPTAAEVDGERVWQYRPQRPGGPA